MVARVLKLNKWFWSALVGLIAVPILVGALVMAAFYTEVGAKAVWHIVTALDGNLSGVYRAGTVARGLQLDDVVYEDAKRRVTLDRIGTSWQWSFSPLRLDISNLAIGEIDVTQLPAPDEPLLLPQSLRLPLALKLERATLKQLIIRDESATQTYRDIAMHGSSDSINHRIRLDRAQTPAGSADMQMYINGDRPFKLSGKVGLQSQFKEQDYTMNAYFSGILEKMMITANLSGGALSGQADIIATPFAPIPFTNAQVRIKELDLAAFNLRAPSTRLNILADLQPVQEVMPEDIVDLQVSGRISVTNQIPGPVDKNLLPIRSLSAEARLDAQAQQLNALTIRLTDAGVLSGSADNRKPLRAALSLQAQNLNMAVLHSALKPTRLSGPLKVAFDDNRQQVQLNLGSDRYALKAEALIDPLKVELTSASLKSGEALLAISGSLTRDERFAYAVTGKLSNFNPALFIRTMDIAAPEPQTELPFKVYEADVNGDFNVTGQVNPELRAKLQFDVSNSTYNKLPMHGSGTLNIAGKQVYDSEAELTIAGNHIRVSGAFGKVGDRLLVNLDAPALDSLGFGLTGLLQLQGSFAGTLAKPQVTADFSVREFGFASHRIQRAQGDIAMQGLPADNSDATLKLDITAQGYQGELAQLSRLDAHVDGSYNKHTLRLNTAGRVRQQRMDLSLEAQGRLQQSQQAVAWSGTVTQFDNRTVPNIHLTGSVRLELAEDRFKLGEAAIEIAGTQLALSHFSWEAGGIRTAGGANAVEVARLFRLRKELTGQPMPFETNLMLDASWDFSLDQQAQGFIQIGRRSGDITTPLKTGDIALGLSQLQLRGDFSGRQLNLKVSTEASRIGSLQGKGSIGLIAENDMLSISSNSPVQGNVVLSVPQLQKIAAFAGPRISGNGNIDAHLELDGTVGNTQLSGDISGQKLALTLYDQGVRLSNGTARMRIENNVLEMQQVQFQGGTGTLRITGSIPINEQVTTRPDLAANIIADNLQLLADPTAQLTLSGNARISSAGEHYAVNGKFTVDQAKFDLPEKAAPKLGDDVVVIRENDAAVVLEAEQPTPEQQARARQGNPWLPVIHLEIDLGRRFFFEGRGANLRLAGQVTITSRPGQQPQAKGTVQVAQGTFEAFGTELAIERGIINFQGSMDNPNINILAMRRNQEVAAGVQVTGTANYPRVTLVSEPDVPQDQKLSWLVFGNAGGGEGQGAAQTAARGAANALLNQLVEGGNIAGRLGLDEISLGTGTSGEQLVTLGKTITEKLTLGYRQGVTGAESAVELTYLLSRHWSVVARGGQMLGINILYSNRFDRFGERTVGEDPNRSE